MSTKPLARDELSDVATTQLGFVTAQQAAELGIGKGALQMLVQRGTLTRVAHGVYRFPQYPVGQYDRYMLAVLWTRAPEACLSHETALDAYGISDVNPNSIHVTVAKHRRLRRAGGDDYVLHREDLAPAQIGWWQEIPTVTAPTAIAQCIAYGTPTYLLRQAIERGHVQGYLKTAQHDELATALQARHDVQRYINLSVKERVGGSQEGAAHMTSAVASRLDAIRNRAGVRSREIAQLLDTTPQTISRWQQGHAEPQPTKLQQLLTLEWLTDQLAEFYEPDEARLWLFSPHRLIGGERPADRIAHGDADAVLALIDQLRDGAYT